MTNSIAPCPLTGEALPTSDEDVAIVFGTAVPPSFNHHTNRKQDGGQCTDTTSHRQILDAFGPFGCGHELSLLPLVAWLQELQQRPGGGTAAAVPYCPVCNTGRIISIVDRRAAVIQMSNPDLELSVMLAFRFGPFNFILSVASGQLEQSRAQMVLSGLTNLVLLHTGAVLYPDPTKSPTEVSERLLQISASDIR